MENSLRPEEWTEEWYKAWKSPDEYSSPDDFSSAGSGSYTHSEHLSKSCSHSSYSVSTNSRAGSSYRPHDSHHSAAGSVGYGDDRYSYSFTPSGSASEFLTDNDDDESWEELPECGELINTKPKINERVTRIHPDYTSELRHSRWRKKYFPRGTFPYDK